MGRKFLLLFLRIITPLFQLFGVLSVFLVFIWLLPILLLFCIAAICGSLNTKQEALRISLEVPAEVTTPESS
jgi:hypothetical protein